MATLVKEEIQPVINLAPILAHLPVRELFMRYDAEADVLYVQFQRPANIHISEMTEDGLIWEYDDAHRLVGVTILEASTR
jgi:uncharacterized protein YuzE